MNFSYWELKEFFKSIDHTIVGSGITGLSAALFLRKKYPNHNIVVIEKGTLPSGASSKNAGFTCFGSPGELIDDLKNQSPEQVADLVEKRWKGLQHLRDLVGDQELGYQSSGGFEVFSDSQEYEATIHRLNEINELIKPIFGGEVFRPTESPLVYSNTLKYAIHNSFEGKVNTGKMISSLLKLAEENRIRIFNGLEMKSYSSSSRGIEVIGTNFEFTTGKLYICTNGFGPDLLKGKKIHPARNQVVVSEVLPFDFPEEVFHMNKGYTYFRKIDQRLLIGGFRNIDPKTEETNQFGTTEIIQKAIRTFVDHDLFPNHQLKFEYSWSGIMGVGPSKDVIVEQIDEDVYCAVRFGGMGVALSSMAAKEMVDLIR